MDEALASLDAQLRSSLRLELKEFQRRDRAHLCVRDARPGRSAGAGGPAGGDARRGESSRLDAPQEIFDCPQSEFVAAFVGNPPMNFFLADSAPTGGSLEIGGIDFKINPPEGFPAQIKVGIRPNDLTLEAGRGPRRARRCG